MRAVISARSPRSTGYCAGAGEPRERRRQPTPPATVKPELDRAEPGVVVGYHQAGRPGEVDLLLPLRDPRHLLPLRDRLDGRQPREPTGGRGADPPDLPQAGHRPGPADHTRPPRQ